MMYHNLLDIEFNLNVSRQESQDARLLLQWQANCSTKGVQETLSLCSSQTREIQGAG